MAAPGQPFAFATWTVKGGKEEAFVAAWKDFARWSRANLPGSQGAYLLRDVGKQNRFISMGPWKDVDSLLAWRSRPEFEDFLKRMGEICEEVGPATLSLVAYV